jgi:tetratricopeptide (TPR) repeat protein
MVEASMRPSRAVRAAVLLALALSTVLVYSSVAGNAFVQLDDPQYVFANEHVSSGLSWQNFRWALSTGYAANWHPLTWISHQLDAELFGLDAGKHHAVGLALHVLAALLLCLVLERYTRRFWPSAFVAAVFALHPLHVESVAWASERKDVLSTVLFVATLLAWLRWTERPSRGRYALVLATYALGLAAKPMLVTLPFVLLLFDAWPLGRLRASPPAKRGVATEGSAHAIDWSRLPALLREKVPLFLLALASSVATFAVQDTSGAVAAIERIPLAVRASNALVSYARYLELSFWPRDLAAYYPHPEKVEPLPALLSLVLLAAASVFALRAWRDRPWLAIGWLWFLGMLVPVIGLVQVGQQALADRYTYVPMVGIAIAIAWSAVEVVRGSRARTIAAAALALSALAVCGVLTRRQVALWKDTETLFGHTVAVTGPNALAEQCLGNALLDRGELAGAMAHLERSLAISPNFPDAHNNLGTALAVQGRYDEAIAHFRAALATQDTADTHHNLGFALGNQKHFDEAIVEYEAALRLDPRHFGAQSKLGAALGAVGRLPDALAAFEKARELQPKDVETRRSIAATLTLLERIEDAVSEYRALLALSPDDLDAINNIAWLRATHSDASHRDGAEAVRLAERAVALDKTSHPVLRDTLAAAYAEAGRFDDAVRTCREAIELARASGDERSAGRFEKQLEAFRAGSPWRAR